MALTTTIPYEDYSKLVADAADKANIISILNAKFKDSECQLLAIKAILGIEDKEESSEPVEPDTNEPTA